MQLIKLQPEFEKNRTDFIWDFSCIWGVWVWRHCPISVELEEGWPSDKALSQTSAFSLVKNAEN